MSITTVRL